jgi:hypothetical protein
LDLEALYRKLEFSSFSQREQIAGEVIAATAREELGPLVRGLEHPHANVRLGIIEILRRATYREGLRKLLAHALAHEGDDRVFAVRAIAQLAEPGDAFLGEHAQAWATSGDAYLEPHGAKLVVLLGKARPAVETPKSDSLDKLVVQLFTAVRGAERIELVAQIERRGPQALVAATKLVLAKGNETLVAYIARAVIRNASTTPKPETLIPLFEQARKRLGHAPIANAAIDDALLSLGALALSPALLSRLREMDKPQADALVARLAESEPQVVALHVPTLLDALAAKPSLWSSLGPVLVYAADHLRESARTALRAQTELVVDELRHGTLLPPVTVASVTWVLAKIGERGEALPRQLRAALDRVAAAEGALALCALCAKLATEDSAHALIAMLRDPLPDAKTAARDAIATWSSPWIAIENDQIVARYVDEKGEPLVRRSDKLVVATSGEEYVLDRTGRPVRQGDTEYGGCLCCGPARALVRRRGEGLRCPTTWESHLRDNGRTLLEKDHALGRCKRCDSVRPRIRDGARVICLDCGAGINADGMPTGPVPQAPAVPSEHGRGGNANEIPKPPSAAELEHVAPPILAAIRSNVFIGARDGDQRWNGSGIIIARDGNHILVLTNRHVVESDDRARLCALDAMTTSGEPIRMSCVWRAKKGIDLALVEGRVEHPEAVGVMQLGAGVGLVGAEVFAIGNPLGLAWSYTAGTLSAIRHWTTPDGQSVRILQTDANIAPGSSGGGLFHRDGHLLGVMSFLRQGYAGGSAHFALSIDAIRQAFAREDVRWHGATLAELPK